MDHDILKTLRKNIASSSNSEAAMRAKDETLQELWTEKQKLLKEMNAAKKKAADDAAKPFLDSIAELDNMYATIIALTI